MIQTDGAIFVFVAWAAVIIVMFGASFAILNKYGLMAYWLDNIITGYLLITQNWPVFFGFIVIMALVLPILSKYIEKESFHRTVTASRYIATSISILFLNFGLFWLIAWLNR
ncbi:MAG: hypothetical protein WC788_05210 [Candidatus Paceibacterota bacterium]